MTATARLWITALYDQDDSRAIAAEAENMAKAESFCEQRDIEFSRSRLQNGTVDLSIDGRLDDALALLKELRAAGIAYGSLDIEGVADNDPRIDALEAFDPHLIISVEV